MNTELETEPTLRDLVQIYRRRRAVVYGITAIICILTAFYCIVCTRRYEATSTIQVQKEGADIGGIEDLLSSGAGGGGDDPLSANIEIQTQTSILQSDTLALRTIDALKMEQTQDFRSHFNLIGWVFGKISPSGAADSAGADLSNSPRRRGKALAIFAKNLKVKPISGTRIIEIDYTNPDPNLAAAVVNSLTHGLADYGYQTRYDATSSASKWLGDQLGDLRKSSEDLQGKVVGLQRQSGVYSLGTVDATGKEQAYSGVLDQLQQATAALALAQQNRILRGAIARAAESGDAEMLSGLAGNSVGLAGSGAGNSLALIQALRQQETAQAAALKQTQEKFGSAYPKLAEMQSNLSQIQQSIQDEIGRLRKRAESDDAVATQTEAKIRQTYDQAKNRADVLNDKAIEYVIVKQEAEQSRNLYEDLLKRLKEAGVVQGLKSSNITIVDPGRAPGQPKTPNVPVYMAIAIFGGWVIGCFCGFLVHTLDNRIDTVHDLEAILKHSPLGVLPEMPLPSIAKGKGVLALADPTSTYVEALRAVRSALLLSRTGAPPKVILITSSIAGEGKSFCSLNLAGLLAQSGRRTLLVDTDLRRGTLRKRLDLPHGPGLSDLLAGQLTEQPVLAVEGIENLYVLIAGRRPPNPTDLLESDALKAWLEQVKEDYDFIILDSAPVLPVTDSVALNVLADVTLLIVRSRLTERPQLQRSYTLLSRGGNHYVGVVLNGLSASDSSYYGYYGYRKYAYAYTNDEE